MHNQTIELREYSSYAYKLMVFMDILTDIDSKWKDNYDTSESMFTELAGLIIEQENQDNGRSSWYDNVVKFLKRKTEGK